MPLQRQQMAPQGWTTLSYVSILVTCFVCNAAQESSVMLLNIRSTPTEVAGCPKTCSCEAPDERHLYIRNCTSDPVDSLTGLIHTHPNVTDLVISNSKLSIVPCELSTLTHLTSLDLSGNSLLSVNCDFGNLTELTTLYLSDNNFESFPCSVATMGELTYLNLGNSQIFSVECDLSNLSKLTHLDLSGNNIKYIPCALTNLSNLVSLTLYHNALEYGAVQCDISNLTHLTSLNLSRNFIQSVPSHLDKLPQLKSLDFKSNLLHSLDSWPVSMAVHSKNISIGFDNNDLSNFTNQEALSATLCSTIGYPFISFRSNRITHFMDILLGWNLNITTIKDLYDCLDIILPLFHENSLNCDCIDYDVYKYLHKKRISYDKLKCQEPLSLRGQDPTDIPLDQFVCDNNYLCPQGCHCHNSPFYQNVNITCDVFKGTTLPEILPDLPFTEYTYGLDFHSGNLSNISFMSYMPKVSIAKFTHNVISDISIDALLGLENVTILHLDDNQLQRLPDDIVNITLKEAKDIRLGKNPWVCDCNILKSKQWMMTHVNAITDKEQLTCSSPRHLVHTQLLYSDDNVFCLETNSTTIIIVVAVSVTALVLICIPLLALLIYRKWRRQERMRRQMDYIDDTDDMEFDIFVSYANEDEDYILEYLIPELERRNFKVCFHRVHFHGGKTIIDNISESINKSKRTLAFFSNCYSDSQFGMWEFKEALNKDLREGTTRLVTIKDTELDIDSLDDATKAYFEKRTYIEKEAVRFWENLLYSLPRNRIGYFNDGADL